MREALKYHIALMLISPVFGLIYTLKASNPQYKKWMLVLFITLFGSTIQFSPGSDATVHQEHVYRHYYNLSLTNFLEELEDILLLQPQQNTNDDVYIHILSFFCGSVLGVPGLFFVIVSFVYGYFYASGLLKVLKYVNLKDAKWLLWAFVIFFIFYKTIDNINTVRTWTGLWVLFNGVFGYFDTSKRKYLLLIAFTPLIHIGYTAMALPALVVCIFKLRPVVYAAIFTISFFAQLAPTIAIEQLSATQVGASKVDAYYIDPESGINRLDAKSSGNWYARYGKQMTVIWGTSLLAATLLISGAYFTWMTRLEQALLSVGILTVSLANFNYFFYALYNRSYAVAALFVIASVILLLARKRQIFQSWFRRSFFNIGLISTLAVYIATFVYILSNMLQFVSAFMLGLPFITWFVGDINLSLREFIGDLIGI